MTHSFCKLCEALSKLTFGDYLIYTSSADFDDHEELFIVTITPDGIEPSIHSNGLDDLWEEDFMFEIYTTSVLKEAIHKYNEDLEKSL